MVAPGAGRGRAATMNARRAEQQDRQRVDRLVDLAEVLTDRFGKPCEFSDNHNIHGHPISLWVGHPDDGRTVPRTICVRAVHDDRADRWLYTATPGPLGRPRVFGNTDDIEAAALHISNVLDLAHNSRYGATALPEEYPVDSGSS